MPPSNIRYMRGLMAMFFFFIIDYLPTYFISSIFTHYLLYELIATFDNVCTRYSFLLSITSDNVVWKRRNLADVEKVVFARFDCIIDKAEYSCTVFFRLESWDICKVNKNCEKRMDFFPIIFVSRIINLCNGGVGLQQKVIELYILCFHL